MSVPHRSKVNYESTMNQDAEVLIHEESSGTLLMDVQ